MHPDLRKPIAPHSRDRSVFCGHIWHNFGDGWHNFGDEKAPHLVMGGDAIP
jgi:hypothetical protein